MKVGSSYEELLHAVHLHLFKFICSALELENHLDTPQFGVPLHNPTIRPAPRWCTFFVFMAKT